MIIFIKPLKDLIKEINKPFMCKCCGKRRKTTGDLCDICFNRLNLQESIDEVREEERRERIIA